MQPFRSHNCLTKNARTRRGKDEQKVSDELDDDDDEEEEAAAAPRDGADDISTETVRQMELSRITGTIRIYWQLRSGKLATN
ncbi:hypothetical protein GWI33_005419 [Rhynchophorus ferrugineus]|uniref:Uncharacterized protein n=1 Tax=Rhynchophorus ferrugineus TaxID=354439 RepID=A0A834IHI0_RHYFE|nr:hypothetical protein GWI33_005419 [Rhynchophorus ferrugineus]